MKRLIVLTASVVLAVGIWASPAEAHNFDAYSFFSCANKRPDGSYVVDHSHPIVLIVGQVWYLCEVHNIAKRCQYIVVRTSRGITGPFLGACRVLG